MNKCWNCGYKINEFDLQCSNCGAEIDLNISKVKEEKKENKDLNTINNAYIFNDLEEDLGNEEIKKESFKKIFQSNVIPMFNFFIGFWFIFWGLFLALSSKEDQLIISWNTKTWPIYLIIGLPVLLFGLKKSNDN